jgi:phosphonate transport system substrate-binding protein
VGALFRRHEQISWHQGQWFYATDYGVIEAQRFNKIQLAWYGNKAAIDAVDRAQGEVFAQFIDLDGTPGYYSYLITHKDSPIKTLDQVLKNGKDYTFGIGDPSSTSDTWFPLTMFLH